MRPPFWRRIPGKWSYVLRIFARRPEDDVDAELCFHFDERAAELIAQGLPPESARGRALEEFGDVESVRARLRDIDRRTVLRKQRADWWESTAQDLKYALRGLQRSPGFTIAVIVTLGLGIGANAAMFSIVDRLLFRPPPMLRNPALIHRIYLVDVRDTQFVVARGRGPSDSLFYWTAWPRLADSSISYIHPALSGGFGYPGASYWYSEQTGPQPGICNQSAGVAKILSETQRHEGATSAPDSHFGKMQAFVRRESVAVHMEKIYTKDSTALFDSNQSVIASY